MVFRDYLFLDLEPSYGWRKDLRDDDGLDKDREGAWSFAVRLEIFFQQQKEIRED